MKLLLSSLLLMAGVANGQFTKPAPIEDTNSNTGSSKCTKKMYECSGDARYNPRVSPNLKSRNALWYDMEGFWVGSMLKFGVDGQPESPEFWNQDIDSDKNKELPYPAANVQMFVNMTVTETRVYKHTYYVYQAADNTFCSETPPDGFVTVVPPGFCGVNGYIEAQTKYATANHEKDGIAEVFTTVGVRNGVRLHVSADKESGTLTPVDANTLYTQVRNKYYSETETQVFNNAQKTRLSGSGQHFVSPPETIANADRSADAPMVLAGTYTFDLNQVSEANFVAALAEAQADANVPDAGRISIVNNGDCQDFVFQGCPETSDYVAAGDPKVSDSPYDDDSSIKPGFIAMFVILGVLLLAAVAFYFHHRRVTLQADRFKHQFARRIAQTIEFSGTMQEVTPEALESEFKKLDEDGSGTISKEELRHFMGDNMSDRDFNALFAAIDLDHNGTVDFEEFVAFMVQIGSMPDIKNEKIVDADEADAEEHGEHTPHLNKKFEDSYAKVEEKAVSHERKLMWLSGFLCVCVIGLLAATIALAVSDDDDDSSSTTNVTAPAEVTNVPDYNPPDIETVFEKETVNICLDKHPRWENTDCVHGVGPQAGANVTLGFVGDLDMGNVTPRVNNYWQAAMCPVNVHWHLGTEHYSVGEYDEFGDGPNGNADAPVRKLAAAGEGDFQEFNVRGGFRCHHYDEDDPKFTTAFDWKHCLGMQVGETYEVHWPHSAAGACGTVNQYQTPFYDGVFCNLNDEIIATLGPQDVANAVGVQGQIFTVVNDESYYYPDLIRGWVVDPSMNMGTEITKYTGSTTGTSRNNEICSTYTPITWQVDRKCHMISASSFDKLCYDMKLQLDDMSDDLYAHGSRELVNATWTANNQQRKRHLKEERARKAQEHGHDHHHHHHHSHDGHGHHHHDSSEWLKW